MFEITTVNTHIYFILIFIFMLQSLLILNNVTLTVIRHSPMLQPSKKIKCVCGVLCHILSCVQMKSWAE
jgi:hypothetical protein